MKVLPIFFAFANKFMWKIKIDLNIKHSAFLHSLNTSLYLRDLRCYFTHDGIPS